MKRPIRLTLILITSILIISTILWFVLSKNKKHTVSDFAFYPCQFIQSNKIDITSQTQKLTLQKSGSNWEIIHPYHEILNMDAESALNTFLASKMMIDEKRTVSAQERERLQSDHPTHVTFYNGTQELCGFELGRSYKLPTVDSERRWLFPDNTSDAYRTFVPLQDFGELFEQPLAGWRQLQMLNLSVSAIRAIEIWTQNESYKLDRSGQKSQKNSMGWQLVSAKSETDTIDTEQFELDDIRVSTVLELLTPFYLDDWANDIPQEEKSSIVYGGKLILTLPNSIQILQIGSEVDLSKHPEWQYLGPGTRYVQVKGDPRLGIISAQRLMGIFPSLDDMRSKDVWHIDSEHLSKIEIQVGTACVKFTPGSSGQWQGSDCSSETDSPDSPIDIHPESLGNYAKTLTSLQAVRYAAASEKPVAATLLSNPDAELRLFFDHEETPQTTLVLSDVQNNLFRYARVQHRDKIPGPIFILTDGIARLILTDLRHDS